jgi:hypothetical protein
VNQLILAIDRTEIVKKASVERFYYKVFKTKDIVRFKALLITDILGDFLK